jgi:hypothetical protein
MEEASEPFDDGVEIVETSAPASSTDPQAAAATLEAQFGLWSEALKVSQNALAEHRKAIEEAKAQLQASNRLKSEDVRSSDELRRAHQALGRELEHMKQQMGRWSEQAQALEKHLHPSESPQSAPSSAWSMPQLILLAGMMIVLLLNLWVLFQQGRQDQRIDKILGRWEVEYLRPMTEGRSRTPAKIK